MVDPVSSLVTSLSRTIWVFTVLFTPLAFALEQSRRSSNMFSPPSSEHDYCHPISTLCNLPNSQRVEWMKAFGWRSSASILYSCLATLFACTWSILQLNLPGKHDSTSRRFFRKMKWMTVALVFPEFIACVALAEFWLALESKKALKKAGADHWTLRHGYFANMGGFVLEARGKNPFPLNSKALEILVTERFVEVPRVTEAEIKDKSKTDSFARVFTILQVSWMVAECIGRRTKGLYVTPLEFLVALCIGISFFTYLFQWVKPKDVTVPIVLRCDGALDDELVERILAIYIRLYGKEELANPRDVTRIPFGAIMHYLWNDDTKPPRWVRIFQFGLCLISGLYNAAHLFIREELFTPLPWRLWRYSCYVGLAVPAIFIPFIYLTRYFPVWLSNILWAVLFILYAVARLLPFVVGLICFRVFSGLPIAVYHDVDWTSFIPHF